MQTQASSRQAHATLTLALVLVVFVCQLFASCWSMSVQFPAEQHPLGIHVHHSHSNHANHNEVNLSQFASATEAPEHQHDSHSHTPCHPPVDLTMLDPSMSTDIVATTRFSYPSRRYAPPIPPPNA
ncbi:hypothetical protein SAMN04488540_11523 [Ferrimonas sediminum]|uniref:Uncharacterized protein n=2 Tax=Ferrimonas sediminum TaxID=718193 RepID=A0A1G8XHH6_9GAMM|nr:hypothetical protein SAMN04488540_11523 [Ferrimonas sediminum]